MMKIVHPLLILSTAFCMLLFLKVSIEISDLTRQRKINHEASESLEWCIERYNLFEAHISYLRNRDQEGRKIFPTADHSIYQNDKGIFGFLSEVTEYLRRYDLEVRSQRIETINSQRHLIFLDASSTPENILSLYMRIEEILFPGKLSEVHIQTRDEGKESMYIALRIKYDQ